MNRKSALTTLMILVLTSCLSVAWGQNCSQTKVAGSYGYTTSGFVATPSGAFVPAAAAGRIVFDKQGNVTGTQTRVVAGSALAETYSGTYTVNPDCNGRLHRAGTAGYSHVIGAFGVDRQCQGCERGLHYSRICPDCYCEQDRSWGLSGTGTDGGTLGPKPGD